VAGATPGRRHPRSPADVPERQGRSETFDPLLLDVLLDEKGFDGGSWIATAGLDHGRYISPHLVRIARDLNLVSHRHLP
jgi:hypothetical protein